MLHRTVVVPDRYDLRATLGTLTVKAVGSGVNSTGASWWFTRTSSGPASLRLEHGGGAVTASAWGEGAADALAAMPALIGLDDEPDRFRPGRSGCT